MQVQPRKNELNAMCCCHSLKLQSSVTESLLLTPSYFQTGPVTFSSECSKHFHRLYHNTRDCSTPTYYKRCARLLTRLAMSPLCTQSQDVCYTFYQGGNSDLPRKCLEIFKNGEDIFYLFDLQRFVTRCILFSYICPTFHICVKHYFIL